MTQLDNAYAKSREKLRLLVRLFAGAEGETERDRLMRDIERLVLYLAEIMAQDQVSDGLQAANHDHHYVFPSAV